MQYRAKENNSFQNFLKLTPWKIKNSIVTEKQSGKWIYEILQAYDILLTINDRKKLRRIKCFLRK